MTQRAAIYARVSTDDQAEHGYSLQTQIDSCRKYAAESGLTVAAEFREEGVSGAKLDRPELDKLRALIDSKQVEAVIVHTADRLSRNLGHSILIREEWQRAAIDIHYADRGKSQDTSEGRLSDNVQAVIAEYEREKIRERTRRGRVAKAKGGWVGAGTPAYGYRRVGQRENCRLEIVEAEAAIIRRIFDMYLGLSGERMSLLGIPIQLDAEGIPPPGRSQAGRGWYSTSVKRILSNPVYIGEVYYSHKTVRANLPELAIIDPDVWQAAQRQREENRRLAGRNNKKHEYLLRGRLRCACGLGLHGVPVKASGKQYLYYACGCWRGDKHLYNCREGVVKKEVADSIVWEWVSGLIQDDTKLTKGIELWRQNNVEQLEPRRKRLVVLGDLIAKAEGAVNRLAVAYRKAESKIEAEALERERKIAAKEWESLIAERERLEAELADVDLTPEREAAIRTIAQVVRHRIGGASFDQKREALELLNFSAQLAYQENQRGLLCVCAIHLNPKFLVFDSHVSKTQCG
jgi:site-specific DNA recombinase